MINLVAGMVADIEALKSVVGNSLKVGPVEVVDAKKGYRVNWGEDMDGNPHLSPWYPHPESGGNTKTWAPLSKGQVVGIMQPHGDPRQGILVRGGFSDENPQPSEDLAENQFGFGGVKLSIKDGVLHIDAVNEVVVNAPKTKLGGEGGRAVARVGDKVRVGTGSSAGEWPIVTGSGVVEAVD